MLRTLIILICLAATPLTAGAWPRGKGNLFVTLSSNMAAPDSPQPGSYTALYIEYGITDRLTFGLDAGRGVSGRAKTMGFLRWPIGPTDRPARLAVEIGFGQIAGEPVLRPGASWGRGFTTKTGSGWINIDLAAELNLTQGTTDIKSDITFGLAPSPKLKAMVQLQLGLPQSEVAFARIVPSVVYEYRKNRHIEFGLTQSLIGPNDTGLKLGFWHAF